MNECKNKVMLKAYKEYLNSNKYHLSDCYENYSYLKQRAFDYCLNLDLEYNLYQEGFKILTYNKMVFTVGFRGIINGRDAFFYITPSYDRYIYIEDLERLIKKYR